MSKRHGPALVKAASRQVGSFRSAENRVMRCTNPGLEWVLTHAVHHPILPPALGPADKTPRLGLPLSAKLMATTSLLLIAAVGVAAWAGLTTIRAAARREVESRRQDGEQASRREAELLARTVAATAALPLAGSSFADVVHVAESAREQYPRILWLVITDTQDGPEARKVVARTGPAPARAELAAELRAHPPGHVITRRQGDDDQAGEAGAPLWVVATQITVGERALGDVQLAVSTADLEAALAASLDTMAEETKRATRWIVLVAALLLILGIGMAAVQGIRIGRPLRRLADQATQVASGKFDQRVVVHSRDEVGLLATSFDFMASRLAELVKAEAQRASFEREMIMARALQQSMLPSSDVVTCGPLSLVGHCVPASMAGGDWWTYRALEDGRLFLVIGDATGHGMDSAIIAGTARGAVHGLAVVDERLLAPERVLSAIHAAISSVGEHNLLMTCFATIIDPRTGVMVYANAGGKFPYVMHLSDERKISSASVLTTTGSPLGDRANPPVIQQRQERLQPGDLVVCYTDGLVDRTSATGKQFGDRRLHDALLHCVIGNEEDALVTLRDEILGSVEDFSEGQPPHDDETLVVCFYDPPSNSSFAAVTSTSQSRLRLRLR
jgi:serine phosphatase RsbU (regulator of sigma subunit)